MLSQSSCSADNKSSSSKLPRRVVVSEVVHGRQMVHGSLATSTNPNEGAKNIRWNTRRPGIESIRTTDGETISIYSGGAQSTPAPGWILLLNGEKQINSETCSASETAFSWTLYGIKRV